MKFKILKTYIITYLKTMFIRLFKYPINVLIFFNIKPNDSLCLYINDYGINNLIIKNSSLLPLIK